MSVRCSECGREIVADEVVVNAWRDAEGGTFHSCDSVDWDEMAERAYAIGVEHGISAASWYFDGNTSEMVYEATLRGIESGDPMVYDTFPQSPLSGEWADSFSVRGLAEELGVDTDDVTMDSVFEFCVSMYEDGFGVSVSRCIEADCRRALEGGRL